MFSGLAGGNAAAAPNNMQMQNQMNQMASMMNPMAMMMPFLMNPQFMQMMQSSMGVTPNQPTTGSSSTPSFVPSDSFSYNLQSLSSVAKDKFESTKKTTDGSLFSSTMKSDAKYPYNPFHRDHTSYRHQLMNLKVSQPRTSSLLNQNLYKKKDDGLNFLFKRNETPRDYYEADEEDLFDLKSDSQKEIDNKVFKNSMEKDRKFEKATLSSKNISSISLIQF